MARQEKELTVEEKLKTLNELQKVDSRIDELRTLAGELPQEVKDMGDEIEGLRTRLQNIEAEIKDMEVRMSDYRVRSENALASISRYEEQQKEVRNNREFDNLNKEIEYQQLDIELCQKKMKQLSADLEARREDKAKTVTDIEEKTVDLEQKRNELDTILAETKSDTEALMVRSAELERHIDERLLSAFKRIRKNARNGLAVVKIERDSCGGCHSKIPAQRQVDIRLRKKIIVCEFCGRILVDPEIDAKGKRKD